MTENVSQPLSASVRRGALWNVATTLVLRLANILITAVVARILDPRAFGEFAVALTAYAIVSAIGEFGVASCLIRADLDIDSLAPTMATVSLATSVILAAAMVFFAEPIAAALGSAYAAGPVRVMALAVIMTGVFAVPGAQLVRDFKQDKLFLANVISFVPSTIALLLLAKTGSGAMAFAWSRVLGQFVVGCVLIASVPKIYLPGIARSALLLLFRFGLPLAAANFVNYILLNVDYALVGHLLGAVALGTYVLAFNVASWPSNLLGAMINNVAMPAFSRVKHDAVLFRDAIINSQRALCLVVMPMCGALMALARPLVLTLYGSKWAASADVLSFLSIYSAISMICLLFANILASIGRTKVLFVIQLAWLAELAPAMALGVRRDGIVGAAIAHIVIIGPVVLPCYYLALKRATGVRLGALAKATSPALLASAAAALVARAATSPFNSPLMQLAAGLSVYGLVYVIAVAPQAIILLNQEQAAKLGLSRILQLYDIAARLIRVPISSRPERVGDNGGGPARQMPSGSPLALGHVRGTSGNSVRRAREYVTAPYRPLSWPSGPLEQYAARFDDLFGSSAQQRGFRECLAVLLAPRDRNKPLTPLAGADPVAGNQDPARQQLQAFLSDPGWDPDQVNARRLRLLRADPATAPHGGGVLVLDDPGDGNDGVKTAHAGHQRLGRYDKADNEVVTATTIWADERLYYPVHTATAMPSAKHSGKGRDDPGLRTWLQIGAALAARTQAEGFAFRAVVADCAYRDQDGFCSELYEAELPFVLALKPHRGSWAQDGSQSPVDAARAVAWHGRGDPGDWHPVTRSFRDGHAETWFAADAHLGGWGPDSFTRLVVVTADPVTMPPRATWYLATNLPRPGGPRRAGNPHPAAGLAEIVRIYGIRHWVRQSYKQVKDQLGWTDFQVGSDTTSYRHQVLVNCAFSFCWDAWFSGPAPQDAASGRSVQAPARAATVVMTPGDPGPVPPAFPLDRTAMLVAGIVERGPAPAAVSPSAAGQLGGAKEAVPQRAGLGSGHAAIQGQLEPDQQRSSQPHVVDLEIAKGKIPESGVLTGAGGVVYSADDTMPLGSVRQIIEFAGADGVGGVSDDTMQFGSVKPIGDLADADGVPDVSDDTIQLGNDDTIQLGNDDTIQLGNVAQVEAHKR
jgi:O-antigen/teichoic acid export membrane protein